MIHPYRNGYSLKPALNKLEVSPFVKNKYLTKTRQRATKTQTVFFEHDINEEIYLPICKYIAQETKQDLKSFPELAYHLAEDVIIHRIQNNKDWMAAGHICLPSGWWPEEKIGKSLAEIHKPIPGMKLDQSYKLAETMINHGPFYRYVWSVVYEAQINCHPSLPKKEFSGNVYVKVETQHTVGFPEIQAGLFVLRQDLLYPGEIDYPALFQACKNMTDAEKEYKGITEELIIFLEKA